MPNVTVPKEFFVKERRMYSNWQFAFWRELFQNSTDAGSSRININIVEKGKDLIGVEFEDNGTGMTREVLETVYFRLGASTKNDGSTVGGFGRARLLTCFSMKNYTIHTLNSLVQGDGGSYEIADVDNRKGCLLQVEIEKESFYYFKQALEEYLSLSQMFCEVYVNGERWKNWCYKRQLARSLDMTDVPFAHVYVNKSAGNSRLIIRVNGTVMYYQHISAKAQVVVEIEPALSREVLTANRDGMHSKYAEILSRFIEELTVDTLSSLRPKFKSKSQSIKGKGLFCSVSSRPKSTENLMTAAKAPIQQATRDMRSSGVYGFSSASGSAQDLPGRADTARIPIAEFTGGENAGTKALVLEQSRELEVGDSYLSNLPDIVIIDDTENADIRKVIDQYNPENWVVCETQGKKYNKGNTLYKLLMLWKVACEGAIQSMMEAHPQVAQVVWGLGWVFKDQTEAMCYSLQGGKGLLLNPVDDNGKLKFGLRSKKDQKVLMALAKHEVAHILVGTHNEEFAAMLTDIDSKYDEKDVFRKMQETLGAIA